MESQPKKESIDLNNREELESMLAKVRLDLSDMEFDLKNGTYPNGVPVEYHDQIDALKEKTMRLEDSIDDLKKDSNPSETAR